MKTTLQNADKTVTKPSADQIVTRLRLKKVVSEYIPHPLLRDVDKSKIDLNSSSARVDDGLKFLQLLLDNSNNQLRQYGTAEELAKTLEIYQNFPLKHKIFGSKPTDYCSAQPVKFKSLKGELFIHKHDFLAYVHLCVLGQYTLLGDLPSKLLYFMKNQQKQLDGCFEFMRYDNDVANRVCDEYDAFVDRKGGPAMANKRKENQLLSACTSTSPKSKSKSSNYKIFVDVVAQSKKGGYAISSSASDSQVHLEGLESISNAHPELFLPYSETNNQNMPVVVRIFEDKSEKFVMKSELFKAINMRNPDQEPLKCDDKNGILQTMDLIEVFKTFKNQISTVEFIRSPITRASHAAVPIVAPSGDHCILAADVLLELLCRLISALKIFRKIKSDTCQSINEYISWLESKFPTDIECKYFINLNIFNEMKRETDEFWKEYENVQVKVAVRDVPKEGFTSKILKKELKYLGITDVFPEIINYAKAVHAEVDQYKREETLRTCDMFNALEHCQLICIFRRFPNLKKILHTQKGCKRIPHMNCETCPIIIRIALADAKETKCEDAKSAEDIVENVEEEKPKENQSNVEHLEKAEETSVKETKNEKDPNKLMPSAKIEHVPYVQKSRSESEKDANMTEEETDNDIDSTVKASNVKQKCKGPEEDCQKTNIEKYRECEMRLDEQVEKAKELLKDLHQLSKKVSEDINDSAQKTEESKTKTKILEELISKIESKMEESTVKVKKSKIEIISDDQIECKLSEAECEIEAISKFIEESSRQLIKQLDESDTGKKVLKDVGQSSDFIKDSEETSTSVDKTKESETQPMVSEESNSKIEPSKVEQKKKNTVPTSDQSKCCPKCLRTSERCNEAMIELKLAQNKLAKNEKKAKNFDDLERKMKEKEKENEQLKRMNSKSSEELEALKLKISKTDLVEEKLKTRLRTAENKVKLTEKEYEENRKNEEIRRNEAEKTFRRMEKELRESNIKLTEKNEALELEMIRLREKRDGDQLSNSMKLNLEREISAKDRIINKLRRTTSRLSIQNEEHEKANRTLIDQLVTVPPPTPVNQSETSSSSRKQDEIPGGMRFQLLGLQKIKDSFRKKNPLKQAEDMVERMISTTNRPEFDQLANYELTQFEGKFRSYTHAVELFIQKLKKSEDGTDVSLLPEFPSFSERFMKEYWNELEKQSSTSSGRPSELADSECLICLANMRPSNKTIKCESCRRRFHSECASEWLKRKSVCPACDRGLLDPADYPNHF